ncbi:MAG: PAS domain S-box protein, partial [Syntrophomonadaceae bacterium]|nr:PAS domain S-box protein [Syntrophomonadaceae bacterium]
MPVNGFDPDEIQEQLYQCEERYKAFMLVSFDRIYRISADWSQLEMLNGQDLFPTASDSLANWINRFIHYDDLDNVVETISKGILEKIAIELDFRGIKKDSTSSWYHARIVPITNNKGEIIEWMGTCSEITESKETEHQLMSRENRDADLLDSSTVGTIILDYKRREGLLSHFWINRLGLKDSNGRDVFEDPFRIVHPEDRKRVETFWSESVRDKKAKFSDEYRIKTVDAGYIWILLQVSLIYDPAGQPLVAYGVYIDIHDRKLVEEALRISEVKLRSLFNSIREGFAIVRPIYDKTGQPCDVSFIEANQVCEQLLAQTNLKGKLLSEIVKNFKKEWLLPYDQVLRTGAPQRVEERSHRRRRWFSVHVSRVAEAGIHQYALVINDITERKNKELLQSYILELSQRIRWLSDGESIQDIVTKMLVKYLQVDRVSYTDYGTGVTLVNNEINDSTKIYEETSNYSVLPEEMEVLLAGEEMVFPAVEGCREVPEEIISHLASKNIMASITMPIYREEELAASLSVQHSSPRQWSPQEVWLVRKTAELSWLAIERERNKQALQESEKKANALVRELEKANQDKNRFISVMSHELRNPLAAIAAGFQVMAAAQNAEQAEKAKEIVLRQVNQLSKLVDDLLDMQRISKNKIKLGKENVHLNKLLIDVVKDMQGEFENKNIKTRVEIPAESVVIHADPVRIIQCIGNLLHNACKFSPREGMVQLYLKKEGDQAVISVQDNGTGINPQILSDLFQPFVQAGAPSGYQNEGGLGLGLSIVKNLVKMHGGTITAYSGGLGQGASFSVRLPVAASKYEADNSKETDMVPAHLKVLV